MKISVIIPSYNQGLYIEETILSIVQQNYPSVEIIIIDGASNDQTIDIIKKHESAIHYWISEKDHGQSHAINKGFAKASGDIICWLNSDDLFVTDTLNLVNDYFTKHPHIDALQGNVINFTENNDELICAKEVFPNDIIQKVPFHQPGMFWRRSILNQIGTIDESLFYCMDYDLWMRIYFNYKIGYINQVLAKFRIHNLSKTSNNPIKMYLEYRKVVSRFFYSIDKTLVHKLSKLKIYSNKENIHYPILHQVVDCKELLTIYINECAIQEYTMGNIYRSIMLFLEGMNEKNFWTNCVFILKNISGIRLIINLFKN